MRNAVFRNERQECLCSSEARDIGSGEVEGDGSAPVIAQSVDFGSRTTTSSALGVGLSPISRHEQPPVRPNGCTVRRPAGDASITERRSSLPAWAAGLGQRIEDTRPDTFLGPADEAIVDGFPRPIDIWCIEPAAA